MAANKKDGEVATRPASKTAITEGDFTTTAKGEARIDSRLIAQHLGIKNQSLCALVSAHKSDFEQFGLIRFQNGLITGKGRPVKFVLLNEDQSYLLLTYSRNTVKVCALKLNLVKAFSEARRSIDIRKAEYLPEYNALHDAIKAKANGSPNERFIHLNCNRLMNQIAGVKAGGRPTAGPLTQSILAVGAAMAARALIESGDGDNLHQTIKVALKPLENLTALGGV